MVLILLPILAIFSAAILHSRQVKKEFLRFDFVQFLYAFVLAPLFFVWIKAFTYYLTRAEIGISLTLGEQFLVDTGVTLAMLYVYAFVVIHSLTKSFEIRQKNDPLYDLFAHSEFFHQQFSHFGIYFGVMGIITALSVFNLIFPLDILHGTYYKWISLVGGMVAGLLSFYGIGKFETKSVKFHKLMKLSYGLYFTVHVLLYILGFAAFSVEYSVFWFMTTVFATFVTASFFIEQETYASASAQQVVKAVLRRSLKTIRNMIS